MPRLMRMKTQQHGCNSNESNRCDLASRKPHRALRVSRWLHRTNRELDQAAGRFSGCGVGQYPSGQSSADRYSVGVMASSQEYPLVFTAPVLCLLGLLVERVSMLEIGIQLCGSTRDHGSACGMNVSASRIWEENHWKLLLAQCRHTASCRLGFQQCRPGTHSSL